MSGRLRWRDAERVARELRARALDRELLSLLAWLPLAPARTLRRLSGLRSPSDVYASLGRLSRAGAVASLRAAVRPGRPPRLWYLADLGLAVLVLERDIEPADVAQARRLRGAHLRGLLPGLPHLLACYELLGALTQPGGAVVLDWQRPWRRGFRPPLARTPVALRFPAYATLAREGQVGSYVLVPDLAGVPPRAFRTFLGNLLAFRAARGGDVPTLIVATRDPRRVAAWTRLLEEARQVRGEVPLDARVAMWSEPGGHLIAAPRDRVVASSIEVGWRPLRPRRPSGALPAPVGTTVVRVAPDARCPSPATILRLALADRALLDVIGRHPFLRPADLAAVLNRPAGQTRHRVDRLVALGLARYVDVDALGHDIAAQGLVELTGLGLDVGAAQLGVTVGTAARYLGLVGGGPDRPTGSRTKLLANLEHTRGVDGLFVGLIRWAWRRAHGGGDDALLEWRNAAACSRGHLRPDGYGIYRHNGRLHSFFLEYDRGTMRLEGYRKKLGAYRRYRASEAYRRDYDGFPTILVVAAENATEERIARAVRVVELDGGAPLPILLTDRRRIDDTENPDGFLGPIWRRPDADTHEREPWPPVFGSTSRAVVDDRQPR